MLGVLIVILCRDRIAVLSFRARESQIPFIASLRAVRALRAVVVGTAAVVVGAAAVVDPPLRACG
jgi:hypothetical protein